ncbi:MAG: metalloregulator ArsR/SmtB family transcription factor [Proteobacteria bacterium]|nr:metalloregulator ArsR/SmtB family transcription factor [Pseudomonadota bacterium]
MDDVFKALADSNRRKILDIVRDQPGINVNDLSQFFDFSRFATMKHLKILQEAKLVLSSKDGKEKNLFINAVPIQTIYERWIRNYEGHWASSLIKLKGRIEEDNS